MSLRSSVGWLGLLVALCFGVGYAVNRDSNPPIPVRGVSTDAPTPVAANAEGVLPVLMLDVKGVEISTEDAPAVLSVIESHNGTLEDLSKAPRALQSAVSVEIHGESSVGLSKRSYRIELVDSQQEEQELPLLGLPAGSDWVLHGCGADRTCLRNALAYGMGRAFGRYAPRVRFTELFVNGRYQGIYLLVERIQRGRNRVNLPRPAATATDGDISGGYIFKTDLGEGRPTDRVPRDWVSSVSPTIYSYYYPRAGQITQAQKSFLHDYVLQFEKVMQSGRWNDPDQGYRRWIDVSSWVDFAIVQELSRNPDAYFKSVYFQVLPRAMGGTLAVGPIWDFDLAFGMAEFREARNVEGWAHDMNHLGAENVPFYPALRVPYVPHFWQRLWADSAFLRDLRCRWTELRGLALRTDSLFQAIDAWATQLHTAQPRDGALWGNPPANEFQNEVEQLKRFLSARLDWMDVNLPGRC